MLKSQRIEIAKKLAVESGPLLADVFRSEYQVKGRQADAIQAQLASVDANRKQRESDPKEQASQALELLDQLERLMSVPEAHPRINALLEKLGIWIGLEFKEVAWGKRAIRKICYGIISVGGYGLPVPLFGRANCDPNRPEGDCGCSAGPKEAADSTAQTPSDGSGKSVGLTAKDDEKGISYTQVSRGDRIRTCDLLVPNQSRYQAALRPDWCVLLRKFHRDELTECLQ